MEDRASPKRIALGFGDLHADAGDHIGHFYRTIEEWKELVIPFFRLGLEAKRTVAKWKIAGRGGAAELLGLRPTTLNSKLRTFGIRRPPGQA